ncbi:OadG family protein [Pyrococcus kukulkanii]|uniref:Methylmalonyl-CoA epimerase n=1 Tax=Pyrococcus kukulkanii TaxID=1609559 RepID=A0A127B8Q1_9EURY|nr:OadG family protein [Pyrococcus kukulkanii]AMM53753.1 methylmalonyl-CoA epimerase [Pyrococcus kukulkanii]RLF86897.1 MAG: methylmalonyl-CoA epimerase [Thermococci archaeon]
MAGFLEGLYITVLGVTVVFSVLSILAIVMYGIGWAERRLVEKEKPKREEKPAGRREEVKTEEKLDEKKVAIITAAIMAYLSQKRPKEVLIKRKPSQNWWLSGLTTYVEEVENFNYELGKW